MSWVHCDLHSIWISIVVSKDRTEFPEVSLDSVEGEEGAAKQDPLVQANASKADVVEEVPHPPPDEPCPLNTVSSGGADPGLSILQDSVLGLRPNGWYLT